MKLTLKTFGSLLLVASVPATLSAQSFSGGDNVIGLGIGAGGLYGFGPVVMLNYDHGMGFNAGPGVVGIGAMFAYKSNLNDGSYRNFDWDRKAYTFALRGTYHWNSWHKNDQLDVYAGVIAGLQVRTDNLNDYYDNYYYNYYGYYGHYDSGKGVYPVAGVLVGAHWYFTDSFGVFAEAGSSVSNIGAGLTLKF